MLTAAALFFLGISDMIGSFDVDRSHAQLMKDDNKDVIKFVYSSTYNFNLFPSEVSTNLEKNIAEELIPIQYLRQNEQYVRFNELGLNSSDSNNYYLQVAGYSELGLMEVNNISDVKDGVIGIIPENYDEVVIPKVIADNIIQNGINKTDDNGLPQLIKPTSYEQLLKDNIKISLGIYKDLRIVGIVNTDLSKYESLKSMTEKEYNTAASQRLVMDFSSAFQNEQNYLIVKDGFVDSLKLKQSTSISLYSNLYVKYNEESAFSGFNIIDQDVTYYDGSKEVTKNTLNDDEVIISSNFFVNTDYEYHQQQEEYVNKYLNENTTREELANKYMQNYVKNNNIIGSKITVFEAENKLLDLTIIGVYNSYGNEEKANAGLFVAKKHFEKYLETTGIGSYLMYANDNTNFEKIFKEYKYDTNNLSNINHVIARTIYSSEIDNLSQIYKVLSVVAFYASVVFFFFATFLLTNFIVISISHRKKEIGILRAIGARAKDVLSIFIWEGIIIGSISLIISLIATIWISNWINDYISAILLNSFISNNFKGLIFTIRQLGLLALVVYLVVFIASLIPTIKISFMKPIDAILNK
jgi:ABC-type antimicrobial peptide transport system permease subunit